MQAMYICMEYACMHVWCGAILQRIMPFLIWFKIMDYEKSLGNFEVD